MEGKQCFLADRHPSLYRVPNSSGGSISELSSICQLSVCNLIFHFPRLYPRHASALNNLGTLTKDVVEAKDYYRRALQLNPQHNRALFNLGNLLK